MAVKSKEVKPCLNDGVKTYPKLMISRDNSLIVLFTKAEVGTVIIGDKIWHTGEHSDTWVMSYFTDYKGTIELTNG